MYNHRVIAFMIFTTAFWIAEMVFAAVGWLGLRTYLVPKEEDGGVKKEERRDRLKEEDSDEMDLSDVPRREPRSGRPVRGPTIKHEDSEESGLDELDVSAVSAGPHGEGAEDEKIDLVGSMGGLVDSAVGTSFSERGGNAGLSRRRSRG